MSRGVYTKPLWVVFHVSVMLIMVSVTSHMIFPQAKMVNEKLWMP